MWCFRHSVPNLGLIYPSDVPLLIFQWTTSLLWGVKTARPTFTIRVSPMSSSRGALVKLWVFFLLMSYSFIKTSEHSRMMKCIQISSTLLLVRHIFRPKIFWKFWNIIFFVSCSHLASDEHTAPPCTAVTNQIQVSPLNDSPFYHLIIYLYPVKLHGLFIHVI